MSDFKFIIEVSGKKYIVLYILIVIGGMFFIFYESQIFGVSLGIISDGFFQLEELFGCSVIVGVGYIVVEMVGILLVLGFKILLMIWYDKVFRSFDLMISINCMEELENVGVEVLKFFQVKEVKKILLGLEVSMVIVVFGRLLVMIMILDVDCLFWVIGWVLNIKDLSLNKLGI